MHSYSNAYINRAGLAGLIHDIGWATCHLADPLATRRVAAFDGKSVTFSYFSPDGEEGMIYVTPSVKNRVQDLQK